MQMREFGKLARARSYIQKSIEILCNSDNQIENIIGKDPIHSTKRLKSVRSLGINRCALRKNYKVLLKYMKGDLNKQRDTPRS